jgi:predicted ATPase
MAYWKQAGKRAVERSAHAEAIEYYRKALASLRELSVTPERTEQELSLLIALGSPLMAIRGYGDCSLVL